MAFSYTRSALTATPGWPALLVNTNPCDENNARLMLFELDSMLQGLGSC